MSESSPMCNVIHMGLTEGTKADPVCEMAEYFIQEREGDINVIKHGDLLCVDIEEQGKPGKHRDESEFLYIKDINENVFELIRYPGNKK